MRKFGRTARVSCSNCLAKIQEMTGVIHYILTSAQSFGSQDYCNKSLMTIRRLTGVLFCENEQTDKMDYRLFRGKYLLGSLGKPVEVSKQ